MKKSASAANTAARRMIVRVPARKIASTAPTRGVDYAKKVAGSQEGGQALIQDVNALQRKLIRQLS